MNEMMLWLGHVLRDSGRGGSHAIREVHGVIGAPNVMFLRMQDGREFTLTLEEKKKDG